jgi:hypothetical protein
MASAAGAGGIFLIYPLSVKVLSAPYTVVSDHARYENRPERDDKQYHKSFGDFHSRDFPSAGFGVHNRKTVGVFVSVGFSYVFFVEINIDKFFCAFFYEPAYKFKHDKPIPLLYKKNKPLL